MHIGNRIYFFNSSPFLYFSYYDIDTKLCQAINEGWRENLENLENLGAYSLVQVHRVHGDHEIGGMLPFLLVVAFCHLCTNLKELVFLLKRDCCFLVVFVKFGVGEDFCKNNEKLICTLCDKTISYNQEFQVTDTLLPDMILSLTIVTDVTVE